VATLDDQVRAIVDERLREMGITYGADVTYDRDHLPPGFRSVEAFNAACRKLGLAHVSGCKAARGWRVPAYVWNEWRALGRFKRTQEKRAATDDDAQADALLTANPRLRLIKNGGAR
jgi:hypothetical protein